MIPTSADTPLPSAAPTAAPYMSVPPPTASGGTDEGVGLSVRRTSFVNQEEVSEKARHMLRSRLHNTSIHGTGGTATTTTTGLGSSYKQPVSRRGTTSSTVARTHPAMRTNHRKYLPPTQQLTPTASTSPLPLAFTSIPDATHAGSAGDRAASPLLSVLPGTTTATGWGGTGPQQEMRSRWRGGGGGSSSVSPPPSTPMIASELQQQRGEVYEEDSNSNSSAMMKAMMRETTIYANSSCSGVLYGGGERARQRTETPPWGGSSSCFGGGEYGEDSDAFGMSSFPSLDVFEPFIDRSTPPTAVSSSSFCGGRSLTRERMTAAVMRYDGVGEYYGENSQVDASESIRRGNALIRGKRSIADGYGCCDDVEDDNDEGSNHASRVMAVRGRRGSGEAPSGTAVVGSPCGLKRSYSDCADVDLYLSAASPPAGSNSQRHRHICGVPFRRRNVSPSLPRHRSGVTTGGLVPPPPLSSPPLTAAGVGATVNTSSTSMSTTSSPPFFSPTINTQPEQEPECCEEDGDEEEQLKLKQQQGPSRLQLPLPAAAAAHIIAHHSLEVNEEEVQQQQQPSSFFSSSRCHSHRHRASATFDLAAFSPRRASHPDQQPLPGDEDDEEEDPDVNLPRPSFTGCDGPVPYHVEVEAEPQVDVVSYLKEEETFYHTADGELLMAQHQREQEERLIQGSQCAIDTQKWTEEQQFQQSQHHSPSQSATATSQQQHLPAFTTLIRDGGAYENSNHCLTGGGGGGAFYNLAIAPTAGSDGLASSSVPALQSSSSSFPPIFGVPTRVMMNGTGTGPAVPTAEPSALLNGTDDDDDDDDDDVNDHNELLLAHPSSSWRQAGAHYQSRRRAVDDGEPGNFDVDHDDDDGGYCYAVEDGEDDFGGFASPAPSVMRE